MTWADEPADPAAAWRGPCATFVGIAGNDLVDQLLDRAEVGDLLHAAGLHQRTGIAALGPDHLEQIFCDLAGDGALADQARRSLQAVRRTTGEPVISRASLLRAPRTAR